MKPGVYTNLTNAEYHGGEGVSKSLLDVVERSPLHAKAMLDRANDNDHAPTAAQALGTALHALLLEPASFDDTYVCELTQADAPHAIADRQVLVDMVAKLNEGRLPKLATGGTKDEQLARIIAAEAEMGLNTTAECAAEMATWKGAQLKAHLEHLNTSRPGPLPTSGDMQALAGILAAHGIDVTLWADVRSRWRAENEGYTVLPVALYEQLLNMRDAVMAHPMARALLTGCPGIAEASVYATDPDTGELRRVRPDFWRQDGIVVDLKTTMDASQEGFAKSLATWGYHRQHPYYLETMQLASDAGHFPQGFLPPKAFVFLAVEKEARVVDGQALGVAVYALDAESVEIGRQQYRKALDTLAECKRTGVWPGYGDTLQQLGVPAWYLNRNLHLIGAA